MVLRPAVSDTRTQAKAIIETIAAPVGGWNARDPLSDMDATDAPILDNIFPGSTDCSLRGGSLRYVSGLGKLSAFSRASVGTYFDTNLVLQTAAIDVPRFNSALVGITYGASLAFGAYSQNSFMVEAAATNEVTRNRDLTNAAWTKTNMTVAKNQIGVDGITNSASLATPTAATGTVSQAIVSAANTGRTFTAFVKRVAGSGQIEFSIDNGSNWSVFNLLSSGQWYRLGVFGSLANPTVVIRITGATTSYIVDYCQEELGTNSTSPIETAAVAVTRAADVPTYLTGASQNLSPAPVETLIEYNYGATQKFLASCNKAIFDISTSGIATTPLAQGYTNDRWQYVNQAQYACLYNGADTPQLYDGTSVTAAVITGIASPQNLIYPTVYGGRIFAVEKDTLNIWYGGITAIQGAFTKLDYSGFFKHGGKLVACGTWSRDGGGGATEFIVFVSNMGEVLVYSGDPAVATSWAKVVQFRTAPPVGGRPLVKISQDLVLISSQGYLPLSLVLPTDRAGEQKFALSDKIRNAVNRVYKLYNGLFGWEGLVYPKGNMCIFNVPTAGGTTAEQHVINTTTGAWCRFTGLNAQTWGLYKENLYFGAPGGYVVQGDTGSYDDALTNYIYSILEESSAGIQWDIMPAYNYFKRRSQQKQFKMCKPIIGASGVLTINAALCVDFAEKIPTNVISAFGATSLWDVALWDVSFWASDQQVRKSWINAPGNGVCATMRLRGTTKGITITFYTTSYAYEPGGAL